MSKTPEPREDALSVYCELTDRPTVTVRDRDASAELHGIPIEAVRRGISEAIEDAKAAGSTINGLRYCIAEIRRAARTLSSASVGKAPEPFEARVIPIAKTSGLEWIEDRALREIIAEAFAFRVRWRGSHGGVGHEPSRRDGRAHLIPWAADRGIPLELIEQWYPDQDGGL